MPAESAPTPKRAPRRSAASAAASSAAIDKIAPEEAATKPDPAPKRSSRRPLTTEHKAALGAGREQGRVVRRYLETLERNRPKRGRRRTPESVKRQLAAVEERLAAADALTRLHLAQERRDLQAELSGKASSDDLGSLEEEFVKVAAEYGKRKGITYASWRESGVSAATLRKASIGRSVR
jgi:hypothetical protein